MESQRLVLNHARIQLESGSLQALAGTGMAGIEDRHIIFFRHLIDCIEQRHEVFLRVDVFFAVGR